MRLLALAGATLLYVQAPAPTDFPQLVPPPPPPSNPQAPLSVKRCEWEIHRARRAQEAAAAAERRLSERPGTRRVPAQSESLERVGRACEDAQFEVWAAGETAELERVRRLYADWLLRSMPPEVGPGGPGSAQRLEEAQADQALKLEQLEQERERTREQAERAREQTDRLLREMQVPQRP
jgi:hypothetical protein